MSSKTKSSVFIKKKKGVATVKADDVESIEDMAEETTVIEPVRRDRKQSVFAIRKDKVSVHVRVVFLQIGEIDTAKENFFADAFVQAKWREPRLDHKTHMAKEEMDWEDYWNPKIYIDNSLGEPKETIWSTLMFNPQGLAFICERRRIKGTFLENLELQEFPFDTQDLTLTIISEKTKNELTLEEDLNEISSINMNSFVDEQEWRLFSYVNIKYADIGKVYEGSGKILHPSIAFMCRATRRAGFFFWNTFFVLFFINTMTFTTFGVDHALPQNRLQLTFILLLTTVAFRSNVNNQLPKISYLTMMDMYILASFVIQCMACAWHAVVGAVLAKTQLPKTYVVWIDKWVVVGLGAAYIIANIVFYSVVRLKVFTKQWQYIQIEKERNKERSKTIKYRARQDNQYGGKSENNNTIEMNDDESEDSVIRI